MKKSAARVQTPPISRIHPYEDYMENDLSVLERPEVWPWPVCPLISRIYNLHDPRYCAVVFPGETTVYLGSFFEILQRPGAWRTKVEGLSTLQFDSLKDIARVYAVDI